MATSLTIRRKVRAGQTEGEAVWRLISHLSLNYLSLIDVRSKLTVLIKWAWAYLWYDPAGRILVERER